MHWSGCALKVLPMRIEGITNDRMDYSSLGGEPFSGADGRVVSEYLGHLDYH
ncbi:hypothetical protein EFER_2535 [Escherichia fergusonii ATCC 35469]|uniref:Uncharacterized protein n=1 Tax=Escherichia fergusonii (strain ATCC 35469 / DSM 13698 / CCUG 18766 / IAM 14443 / JCM 21226 / LMG 7866 / NBRC 102419 / NCTC 12128 / CDC 0568-73) TaxID=585054 RepID=B7LLN9_ESCF3|nr:hypothetical protein EFER_2535 [Escherichia fergusonii ATCC 35469]